MVVDSKDYLNDFIGSGFGLVLKKKNFASGSFGFGSNHWLTTTIIGCLHVFLSESLHTDLLPYIIPAKYQVLSMPYKLLQFRMNGQYSKVIFSRFLNIC